MCIRDRYPAVYSLKGMFRSRITASKMTNLTRVVGKTVTDRIRNQSVESNYKPLMRQKGNNNGMDLGGCTETLLESNGNIAELAVSRGNNIIPVPVSYTHLDVYKRQL